MSGSKDAIAVMTSFIEGKLAASEFGERFSSIWRELRDSGQCARENVYVQRGLNAVFTALDDSDNPSKGKTLENQVSILLAEVRAILSVIRD